MESMLAVERSSLRLESHTLPELAKLRITAQGYRLHNEGTLAHYSCWSGKQYAYRDICAIPHYAEQQTLFFNR